MASKYMKKWRRNTATAENLALYSSSSSDDEPTLLSHCSVVVDDGSESEGSANMADYQGFDEVPGYVESCESDCEDGDAACDLNKPILQEALPSWAVRNNITRNAVNELLSILICDGHKLPRDARTLLKTPQITPIVEKCGGEYLYFGIETGILKQLVQKNQSPCDGKEVGLVVNIDGLPIHKSSCREFWPILCAFDNCTPFIVALYFGRGKPRSVAEYLHDFLEEYRKLKDVGIEYSATVKVSVIIKSFVCDAPARAFVKCVKGHTAFQACERCTIQGTRKEGRTVLYSKTVFPARTESNFKNLEYKEHQHELSPLILYDIPCIQSFSLDYMHLICLGVVKRMLFFLKSGPRQCRLSATQLKLISDNLQTFSGKMPSEFVRQPRPLDELERWKATEFRQFLLYTGPVVLKKILDPKVYDTFMCLSVAVSILLDECDVRRLEYLQYARELLQVFVSKSVHAFGEIFVVYNVHNLLHIADDVEYYGCSLNDISAFPFENYLQTLKRLVRCGRKPLAQVWRRVNERDLISWSSVKEFKSMCISVSGRNSVFLLSNSNVAIVKEKLHDDKFECDIIKDRDMESFFVDPCDSKLLNILFVRNDYRRCRKILRRHELTRKAVYLPYSDGHVIFPLLHNAEK